MEQDEMKTIDEEKDSPYTPAINFTKSLLEKMNQKKEVFIYSFLMISFSLILIFNFNSGRNEENKVIPKLYDTEKLDEIIKIIPSIEKDTSYYFLNGMIRWKKPVKLLEIGPGIGESSAVILNAIKDMPRSFLYSVDINAFENVTQRSVGYLVHEKIPLYMKKWKLFTGKPTSSFLEEIGKDIDFVYLDTTHIMPGEVLNFIEILPFLKENAIIIINKINFFDISEQKNEKNFYPCNNLLFTTLRGQKLFEYSDSISLVENKIGAVILAKNQKQYYFDYFYLLSNMWAYLPKEEEISEIRKIIEKYYEERFVEIFDGAVSYNKGRLAPPKRRKFFRRKKKIIKPEPSSSPSPSRSPSLSSSPSRAPSPSRSPGVSPKPIKK